MVSHDAAVKAMMMLSVICSMHCSAHMQQAVPFATSVYRYKHVCKKLASSFATPVSRLSHGCMESLLLFLIQHLCQSNYVRECALHGALRLYYVQRHPLALPLD